MISRCGWDPLELVRDRTLLLDGNGISLLTLPSLWVTDVSAVVVTDLGGTAWPLTIGPCLNDIAWSDNGVLELKTGWVCGGIFPADRRNVAVTYSGGYAKPPDDLQAALDSVSKRAARESSNVRSKRMGQTSITYNDPNLLTTEQMVFDRYRLFKAA